MRASRPPPRGRLAAAAALLALLLAATAPGTRGQQAVGGVSTTRAAGTPAGAGGPVLSSSSSAASAAGPAPGAAGCQTVTQTSSSSCAAAGCCAVKQRVTACADHTTALASINGYVAACCVVLTVKATGAPAVLCAGPTPKGGAQTFPPGVSVTLSPDCTATSAGSAGSLTCVASFPRLPRGLAPPPGALALKAGSGPWGAALPPCGNAGYRTFTQTAVPSVGGSVTFTTQCTA